MITEKRIILEPGFILHLAIKHTGLSAHICGPRGWVRFVRPWGGDDRLWQPKHAHKILAKARKLVAKQKAYIEALEFASVEIEAIAECELLEADDA